VYIPVANDLASKVRVQAALIALLRRQFRPQVKHAESKKPPVPLLRPGVQILAKLHPLRLHGSHIASLHAPVPSVLLLSLVISRKKMTGG
jgi:hypothetical protein